MKRSIAIEHMPHHIEIEPVKYTHPEHQAFWLEVRTDPAVHGQTRNPTKRSRITPEEHERWWMASAINVKRRLFLINDLLDVSPSRKDRTRESARPILRRVPIGILRLDHRGDWTEIWMAIKSPYRRRGIGTQTLVRARQIIETARWPPLGAVIHAQKNMPAWRLFMRGGFLIDRKGFIKVQLPST